MKIDELIKEKNDWYTSLKYKQYSKKTLTEYDHGIQLFIDFLKNKSQNEFNFDMDLVLDYRDYMKEKFAASSFNKNATIFNKFCKETGKKEFFIKKLRIQKSHSIDDPILEQEHKRMLRWAKKKGMEDMYFILEIFAYTGCRVEELKFFTVESLNSNYIKKVYNKGKERTIILRNDLKRDLKNYCKRKNIKSGYIFISTDPKAKPGAMWNNSTIWRRLKRIARSAKINPDKIHPHAWRHLFAKKSKEAGIDLDELQDIMGHSDIRTTAIYTQTSNREKRTKIEKMKY